MAERANITSIEALDAFRAALVLYLSKARPTLDEINSEVVRLRVWLESDRRMYWEKQVRRCAMKLEEAKQAVFSAEMSNLRQSTTAERSAVTKAQRDLADAEQKSASVKKWISEFESRVSPLAKQLERLQSFLSSSLPQAQANLLESIRTLEAYVNMAGPGSALAAAAPAGEVTPPETISQPAEAGTTNETK
jgi:septal ring factor EnvC (AmiA/AmiB activator)